MRKKIYISFIMIGIMSLIAHVFIPHHEHKDKVCFEFSLCDSSETNSQETTKTTSSKAHSCCLDTQDVLPQNEKNIKHTCNPKPVCDYEFPPILLFIGSYFDFDTTEAIKIDKPYLNLYSSIDIFPANTFRGPPQI